MYRLSVYKNCETDQSQIENQTDCRTVFQVGRSGGWVGISIFIVRFKVALHQLGTWCDCIASHQACPQHGRARWVSIYPSISGGPKLDAQENGYVG